MRASKPESKKIIIDRGEGKKAVHTIDPGISMIELCDLLGRFASVLNPPDATWWAEDA